MMNERELREQMQELIAECYECRCLGNDYIYEDEDLKSMCDECCVQDQLDFLDYIDDLISGGF